MAQPTSAPISPCGVDSLTPYEDPLNHTPSGNEICVGESLKIVRLAFHFLLTEGNVLETVEDDCTSPCSPQNPCPLNYYGPRNFTEYSDGNGNYDVNGYDIAKTIVDFANAELAAPAVQRRKETGINYPDPAIPVGIQYVLSGVYFHRDNDAHYGASNDGYLDDIHNQYSVEPLSIINVYFSRELEHGGIANWPLGGIEKYAFLRLYDLYLEDGCRDWAIEAYAPATLNHEVGHLLGLHHSWNEDDDCADTPMGFEYDHISTTKKPCFSGDCCVRNANCWSYNPNIQGCPVKPCDDWSKISNNGMDYNSYFPHAYTNCQISEMHENIEGIGNAYVYACDGCLPAQSFFDIRSPFVCPDEESVMMDASGSFNATEYKYEICLASEVSGNCIGSTYSSGWILGEPGLIDLTQVFSFDDDAVYKVSLFTKNASCNAEHEFSKLISIENCSTDPPFVYVSVQTPVSSFLNFEYSVGISGSLEIVMVNSISGNGTVVKPEQQVAMGSYNESHNISQLPTGTYYLIAIFNNQIAQETVIKI